MILCVEILYGIFYHLCIFGSYIIRCFYSDPSAKSEHPAIEDMVRGDLNLCSECIHVIGVCFYILTKSIYDCVHNAVVTNQFDSTTLAVIHPEHRIKIVVYVKVFWLGDRICSKNSGLFADSIYSEAPDIFMLI